ncbi:uncharacterized protein LOC121055192 [Oryza brachyantha]|nr:uncharacterized protein LOC121055192 [Oryza brachyantha]
MEVEERKPAAGMGADGFTEADLAAADQLVQLSASFSGGGGCEEDGCDSSSSATLSVNNADAAALAREFLQADDDMGFDRRVRKKYRLLSELYAATRPVKEKGGGDDGGGKRKKREEEMGMMKTKKNKIKPRPPPPEQQQR